MIPRTQATYVTRAARIAALGAVLVGQAIVIGRAQTPIVQSPTFRGGVRSVAVDVIVRDEHGRALPELTASDFEVRDQGELERLTDCRRVQVAMSHRAADARVVPVPVDVIDNRAALPSSRAFVVVIDDGAIAPEYTVNVTRFLTSLIQDVTSNDRVAIVFTHRSDLAQDFTGDPSLLARAASRVKTAIGWGPSAPVTRVSLEHAIAVLGATSATRRSIVYVSDGFQTVDVASDDVIDSKGRVVPDRMSTGFLQKLFDKADRADVTIYAVDPRGLLAPELNLGARLEDQTPENRAALDVANRVTQDTMRVFADNTRGLAFVNTSQFDTAAESIVADNSDYYLLTYSPRSGVTDGQFHRIRVTVPGRPELRLRAKPGYVATDVTSTGSVEARLNAAVSAPDPQTGLPLRAVALPVRFASQGNAVVATVRVTYPEGFENASDRLLVQLVAADPDGRTLRARPNLVLISVARGTDGQTSAEFDQSMTLPSGHWTLIIGVASDSTGSIGTLHVPVDIPAPSALTMTSIVVGDGQDRSDVALRDAIASLLPFQPTTDRSFRAGGSPRFFARIFADTRPTVSASLQRLGGEGAARRLATAIAPGSDSSFDVTGRLDSIDAEPGDYALVITVKARGRTEERSVGIQLLGRSQ